MRYIPLISRILVLSSCLFLSVPLPAQQIEIEVTEAGVEEGKTLFRNYCGICHARDMQTDLVGPALGGTLQRWGEYPKEDLFSWIRNSQQLISQGHPRAEELWAQWQPAVMVPNPNLTDEQITNILAYINCTYEGNCPGQEVTEGRPPEVEVPAEEGDNTLLFILLAVILGILAIILARIVSNLNYMVQMQEGEAPPRRKTLVEILTSKGIIAFVIFALVVLGGYTTVNNAIMLGRQQGYQPVQPIIFSHTVHAGQQQINCQYCHDGAHRSKHAVIPALNTCMNCHRAIKVGSSYGTAELTKIFAAIGYDPSADVYIENYDQLGRAEIERIYKKWIADNYVQQTGAMDAEGEQLIENQWEGVINALTNEYTGDNEIAGPVEWVRIHNLPDHVYFSHAQHVSIGQVECQTCHGLVEQMDVVYQYSPLSMGWCVNCHRQTGVQFDDNEYYESYERYHRQIANGERNQVTVEEIGGLECQKCHY